MPPNYRMPQVHATTKMPPTDGLSSTMFVSEALMGTGSDVCSAGEADPRRHWMSMGCSAVPTVVARKPIRDDSVAAASSRRVEATAHRRL
jgi:hypothetical protein